MSPMASHTGDSLVVGGLRTVTKGSIRTRRHYRTYCNTVGLVLFLCPGTMRSCSLLKGLLRWTSPLPEHWCPFCDELLPVCAESWFGAKREMGLKMHME